MPLAVGLHFDDLTAASCGFSAICHSTAFLYSTTATVQMLKLYTVRWFSRPWRETRR